MTPETKKMIDELNRCLYRSRICPECKQEFFRHHNGKVCHPCSMRRQAQCMEAMSEVAKAIRNGHFPNIKRCLCVDCGAPAGAYDHRDYSKPLDVEPVCRSCNHRRWPAKLKADLPEYFRKQAA